MESRVLLAKKTTHVLAELPVHLQRFAPKLSWYEWAEANGILSLYEEDDYGSEGCVSSDWVDVSQVIRVEDVQKFDDKQDSEFYGFASLCRNTAYYEQKYISGYMEPQRILIWRPAHCLNASILSVFCFCELVGDWSDRLKFGDLYNTLLTGDVLYHKTRRGPLSIEWNVPPQDNVKGNNVTSHRKTRVAVEDSDADKECKEK
ncbi:unnamed protein product [Mesocestoides corti]|uniref:Uncharacterized protein n=1 Tax=Mesocestoides corti TaxID=53468 RepID=A0A3P6HCU7_MESCO|nr:unnamed protein product [Mesocestoides corti]